MTAEGKSRRSRPTGAERLTLAAATQRRARMAAPGRRSPSREAMNRPTIDGLVSSITDTTGAERPRSRATGGQRDENPRSNLRFSEVLERPRTVYSPLTSLAKNLQPAYFCLLCGIPPFFIGTYKRTSGDPPNVPARRK